MGAPQTTIYQSVLIACLVMAVIMIYFFISVIRQQRANLELRKKSILNEISGLEKERARIAADLHDELGPLLAVVKMRINSFELTDPDDEQQLDKTNTHIDDILKRMREISFDLLPHTLLKKGLATALAEYVDFLNNHNQIHFSFVNDDRLDIHDNKSVNIYRIVQEAVNNSLKHARATDIRIELKNKNNKFQLAVSDNGIGFDFKKALGESTGIGLNSLNNRAQIAGGKMFVESTESGTSYLFEIPV